LCFPRLLTFDLDPVVEFMVLMDSCAAHVVMIRAEPYPTAFPVADLSAACPAVHMMLVKVQGSAADIAAFVSAK
jgi:hypothetical protein